jgi:hypothetical protein
METPEVIFIIPYRSRPRELERWINHMTSIFNEEELNYEVFVIHQKDKRRFNRGAMKNIGFHMVKRKYPKTYQEITLVFNDVDTMPREKGQFTFPIKQGYVRHYVGFKFAFGGIVSMRAGDFESIGGYPNLWSWGLEDNMLRERWVSTFGEKTIDYSQFISLPGNSRKKVNEQIILDTSFERGREINVQIGSYVNETRVKNAKERKMNKPLSESLHVITNIKTKEHTKGKIRHFDVEQFNTGTKDVGYYERRYNLRRVGSQKILKMGQLMMYGK